MWNDDARARSIRFGREGFVFVSGLPPFDPETGDVRPLPFERQAEIVLDQMKRCLEAAGSSLAKVVKSNVYCTPDPSHYARFNTVSDRYFTDGSPPRIFLYVPSHTGPFDVESRLHRDGLTFVLHCKAPQRRSQCLAYISPNTSSPTPQSLVVCLETHMPGNANSNFILSDTRILSANYGPRGR